MRSKSVLFGRLRFGPMLVLLLSAGVLLAACNPLREVSSISVTVKSTTQVDGQLASDVLSVGDFGSFSMSSQQEFENSDATRNNLESSSLQSFVLRIKDPEEGQDLSFLEEMTIHINTEGENRIQIAHYDEFEVGDQEVRFTVRDDRDLTPYFTAEEAEIETTTKGSQPDSTKTLEAEMTFDINFFL